MMKKLNNFNLFIKHKKSLEIFLLNLLIHKYFNVLILSIYKFIK